MTWTAAQSRKGPSCQDPTWQNCVSFPSRPHAHWHALLEEHWGGKVALGISSSSTPVAPQHIPCSTAPWSSGHALGAATHPTRVRAPLGKPTTAHLSTDAYARLEVFRFAKAPVPTPHCTPVTLTDRRSRTSYLWGSLSHTRAPCRSCGCRQR
jgi:hypothetical protein